MLTPHFRSFCAFSAVLILTAIESIERLLVQIEERDDEAAKVVRKSSETLTDSLVTFNDRLFGAQGKQGIYRDPYSVSAYLRTASNYIGSGYNLPTSTEERAISKAREVLGVLIEDANRFFADDWVAFGAEVNALDISLVGGFEPVRID